RRASSRMRFHASFSDSCMPFFCSEAVGMSLGQAKLRPRCGKVNLDLRGMISLGFAAHGEQDSACSRPIVHATANDSTGTPFERGWPIVGVARCCHAVARRAVSV